MKIDLIIFFLFVSIVYSSTNLCFKGDSDCPACPSNATESFTTLLLLSDHLEFVVKIAEGEKIIESYGNSSNIISMEYLWGLHTSITYFCCYSPQQKIKIIDLLYKFKWDSIKLTYNNFGCNLDRNY